MKNHPLEVFKYCPKCGSELFEEHNAKSKHCSNCGFTYYQNPSSATAAFILNSDGELLVVQRGKEPAKGTLDLPGGVEYLFSIPNIYRYSGMDIHTLDMFYLCHAGEGAEIQAADDAAACSWIPLRQVYVERFGLRSIREGVHRFLMLNR